MGGAVPAGPLVGEELAAAAELLTDKQLRAYQYYREGLHTMGWIATRMGTSRQAVMQLIVKAEKRLGYPTHYTPKQKGPRKSAAERRRDHALAQMRLAAEAFEEMPPDGQLRILRQARPGLPAHLSERERWRILEEILVEALTDDEAKARLGAKLRPVEQQARRRRMIEDMLDDDYDDTADDASSAVGEYASELAASLETDFGLHPGRGDAFRPEDFVEDDGRGYDR